VAGAFEAGVFEQEGQKGSNRYESSRKREKDL
jgi:hypothetical protein